MCVQSTRSLVVGCSVVFMFRISAKGLRLLSWVVVGYIVASGALVTLGSRLSV